MYKEVFSVSFILAFIFLSCEKNNNSVTDPEFGNTVIDPSAISIDSLMSYVKILSGEDSFNINGRYSKISSRHRDYDGNNLSAEYIKSKLKQFGLSVQTQSISGTCKNIISIQKGEELNSFIVLGAHYDSVPHGPVAPGADDNASGVSIVLEAARLVSKFNSKYSIIYAFWDEEEVGAFGSKYFGQNAQAKSQNINLVLNVDMVAYDSDNDWVIGLYRPESQKHLSFVQEIENINDENNFGINLKVIDRAASSDDFILSEQGYKTLGFVEVHFDSTFTDFNKYWHTTNDTVDKFNLIFYERNAKLIISSLAYFSKLKSN